MVSAIHIQSQDHDLEIDFFLFHNISLIPLQELGFNKTFSIEIFTLEA